MPFARNVAETDRISEKSHFVARALLLTELDDAHEHPELAWDVSPMERA